MLNECKGTFGPFFTLYPAICLLIVVVYFGSEEGKGALTTPTHPGEKKGRFFFTKPLKVKAAGSGARNAKVNFVLRLFNITAKMSKIQPPTHTHTYEGRGSQC